MRESNIVLAYLPQADGQTKLRPALVLRVLPPFGDLLLCGLSTQLQQQAIGFDEVLQPTDLDFGMSGLKTASLIRLAFLTSVLRKRVKGIVGIASVERHERLLRRPSDYLSANLSPF